MSVNVYHMGIQEFKSPITVRLVTPVEIGLGGVNTGKNAMLIQCDCMHMLLP